MHFARFFFVGFELGTLFERGRGIFRQRFAGEDIGMAAHQFIGEQRDDIFDGEAVFFLGDLGVKDYLQKHIAELLCDFFRIAVIEGIEQFIGLFEQAGLEREMSLRPYPMDSRHRCAVAP